MSEADPIICKMSSIEQWSDLPCELLSQIADRLELIEFLSFQGVCKDWRSASPKTSSEEKCRSEPWFLIYGEGSKCSLLSNKDKSYTIELPELDGATCLASYKGWLLLFSNGSMFFFCPFSKARIDVPNCPFSELSDHVAAFSSAPTSKDCIIGVVSRKSDKELELHMLLKGSNKWSNIIYRHATLNTISAALIHDGEFNFLDKFDGLVMFGISGKKSKEWKKYTLVSSTASTKGISRLGYHIREDNFASKDMRRKLGLESNVTIAICGTFFTIDEKNILIHGERIEAEEGGSEIGPHLKGVWIQPRYFEASPNQSW
ncbi:hypothetical protein RIF29_41241 [Crotalaria pallida]|uniref:F-box domain-containing protein n=1 Tax=Crotalaria pallida TaxID=3830 RepID=A0AAN9E4L6_CROPI